MNNYPTYRCSGEYRGKSKEDREKHGYEKAIMWLSKSVEQGYNDACILLSKMYREGYERNNHQRYIEHGYKSGDVLDRCDPENPVYQNYKGNNCFKSKGYQEALNHYRKSASHGNSEAMRSIGRMYQHGTGVDDDLDIAFKWFSKAAKHGSTEARELLKSHKFSHMIVVGDHIKQERKLELLEIERMLIYPEVLNDVIISYLKA